MTREEKNISNLENGCWKVGQQMRPRMPDGNTGLNRQSQVTMKLAQYQGHNKKIVLEVGVGAKRRPEAPTGTLSDRGAVFVCVCPVLSSWANLCSSIWLATNKGCVCSKIKILIYIYILYILHKYFSQEECF